MHELPYCLSLLDVVKRETEKHHIAKITDIDLAIGELSGVVDSCMELYFESASIGTAAEGAKLHFRHVPARLRCEQCGFEFPHKPYEGKLGAYKAGQSDDEFCCPKCGGQGILVKGSGTEFEIERLRAEDGSGD